MPRGEHRRLYQKKYQMYQKKKRGVNIVAQKWQSGRDDVTGLGCNQPEPSDAACVFWLDVFCVFVWWQCSHQLLRDVFGWQLSTHQVLRDSGGPDGGYP